MLGSLGGGAAGVSLTTRLQAAPQKKAGLLYLTLLRDKTAEVREANSPPPSASCG